jgi:SAM-dependent methyltransferase
MKSPEAVLSGIFKALKPGGVFVAEFGGLGNADKVVVALEHALNKRGIAFDNPWYFPSAEEYSALLIEHGFIIEQIELFDRFTPLPQHLSDWILTFAQSFLQNTSAAQSKVIIDEVVNEVREELYQNQQWHVDYVRLRLKAIKPS